MTRVTLDTRLSEVLDLPELAAFRRFLIYSPMQEKEGNPLNAKSFRELKEIGWSSEGMTAGVNFLLEALDDGRASQLFVYPEADCAGSPGKQDVNLLHIRPAQEAADKPWILLCAGGGYMSVCTVTEALPTARHMSELGYHVFMLTYRVALPGAALLALDDLAAAVKYIRAHHAELGVDPERYAVGGYSAGANLVSNYGCTNIGYRAYDLPKPVCMFPIYTYIDVKADSDGGGIIELMLGQDWRGRIPEFQVTDHVDADYPPCYIVCGQDDKTVPWRNSQLLKAALDAARVPAVLEAGEHAPHGFGDGTGTDVEGWPERAVAFMEGLTR